MTPAEIQWVIAVAGLVIGFAWGWLVRDRVK
jgi:hypothetical protein